MKVTEFKHATYVRGNYRIEIVEVEERRRLAYDDIVCRFSINVTNMDNPDWYIKFAEASGRIKVENDKGALIGELKSQIVSFINLDEQGEVYLNPLALDFVRQKHKV